MKILKEHKEDIVRSALAFKFKDAEVAIAKGREALGEALYAHVYGADEMQARSMPKGWISYGRSIDIECDGYSYKHVQCKDTSPDNLHRHLPLSQDRPMPACDPEEKVKRRVKPGHPLWKQAWGLVQQHRKLRAEKQELETKLRHLLSSVNTLKQLQEAWPEGSRFFPKEVKTYAIVPVGLSDQINEALGLPEKADNATKAVRKAAKQGA